MCNRLTLEQIPEAIQGIQTDISEIKRLLNPQQTAPKNQKTLMTVKPTAEFLDCSVATVYRNVAEAKETGFPYHKQGSRLYFIEAELIAWVTGRKNSR